MICTRHDQPTQNYTIAREMLYDFLEGVKKLYGDQLFSSNMHSLCHLVDDVERFGPLDTFSAYSFESRLFTIKNLIRSGNLPLSQVARRISEIQCNLSARKNRINRNYCLNKYHNKGTLPSALKSVLINQECELYSCVQFENFRVYCNNDADRWILLTNFRIIEVQYILKCINSNDVFLYGDKLKTLTDIFDKPIRSSLLQIYSSDCELEKSPQIFSNSDVYAKMVKVPERLCYDNDNKSSIFIPLLHTLLGNYDRN